MYTNRDLSMNVPQTVFNTFLVVVALIVSASLVVILWSSVHSNHPSIQQGKALVDKIAAASPSRGVIIFIIAAGAFVVTYQLGRSSTFDGLIRLVESSAVPPPRQ